MRTKIHENSLAIHPSLYGVTVAIMFAVPLLVSLCCYTLNVTRYFEPTAVVASAVGVVFCAYIAFRHYMQYGYRAFGGLSYSIILLLLLMFLRLFYDTVISPQRLFNSTSGLGTAGIWLDFVFRLLIPVFFFSLVVPARQQRNLFKFYGLLVGLECALAIIVFQLSQWKVWHFQNMNVYVNGITVAQAGSLFILLLLWAWHSDLLKTWMFYLLCPLGTYTFFMAGKRGPVVAGVIMLVAFVILAKYWKKKYALFVLAYVVTLLVLSHIFVAERLTKRMEFFWKSVIMLPYPNETDSPSGQNWTVVPTIEDVHTHVTSNDVITVDAPIPVDNNDTIVIPPSDAIVKLHHNINIDPNNDATLEYCIAHGGNRVVNVNNDNTNIEDLTTHVDDVALHVEDLAARADDAVRDDVNPENITDEENITNKDANDVRETPKSIRKRLVQFLNRQEPRDARLAMWITSIIKFVESPLWGNPPVIRLTNGKDFINTYTHNSVLESFMVWGVFGGVLFLFVVGCGIRDSIWVIQRKPIMGFYGVLFLFFFIQSLSSYSIYTNVRMWFALVAVTAIVKRYKNQCQETGEMETPSKMETEK